MSALIRAAGARQARIHLRDSSDPPEGKIDNSWLLERQYAIALQVSRSILFCARFLFLFSHHHSPLHYKRYTLHCGNVFERVARYGDDICVISALQLSNLPSPAQTLRAI